MANRGWAMEAASRDFVVARDQSLHLFQILTEDAFSDRTHRTVRRIIANTIVRDPTAALMASIAENESKKK